MFEFRLPDVGEGVAEGEVVAWHVEPGEEVEANQVVVEVETDKAVVDLPSPVAGTVEALHAEVGEVVPVGEVLVTIDPADAADTGGPDDGESVEATPEPVEPGTSGGARTDDVGPESGESSATTGRVFAPPHVRRLARELGVDVGTVDGTGPGGRITDADVREVAGAGGADDEDVADAITEIAPAGEVTETGEDEESVSDSATGGVDVDGRAAAGRDRTLAAPATRQLADELGVDLDAVPTEKSRHGEAFVEPEDVEAYADARSSAAVADDEGPATAGRIDLGSGAAVDQRETREPYRGVRRTIGEQMERSADAVPHVTHHDAAVVASLVEAREAMKPRAEARGVTLTYVPFVLKAVVAGLREYPILNSTLDEEADEIVVKHHYDLGVATATDAGLMVPVVGSVDEKGLFELAAEVNELAARARDRSITREEMQGGTFTVTNFGAVGGEYATPIVNYPETAILGLGAIERRPVVVDGEVEARHTLPLSLSIDHRVVDGAEAARFANAVIEHLETPSLLLLE